MNIRGERECKACETRWSYYETGSINCPACGSLHSVGRDDRQVHTDTPVELELTPVRNAIDEVETAALATRARKRCQAYRRQRGFLNGGDLRDLEETYLGAAELAHVADTLSRRLSIDEAEELYFLTLLAEVDSGTRPPASAVPPSLYAPRGLAAADAVDDYRRDCRTWIDAQDIDLERRPADRATLEVLGDHVTRIQLLEGDVSPQTAETLISAARDIATALREDDDSARSAAQNRLDRLQLG